MKNLKLKICGMKHNTDVVAHLRPDYLGFIFYEKSPRNFEGIIPELGSDIKKVGVFVDASMEFIIEKVTTYELDIIQLHGDEAPEFCSKLKELCRVQRSRDLQLWKVFSIKDHFNFNELTPYEKVVDTFLFDTKGKDKGGNGYTFNWEVLKDYPSNKPFVLSGGIGLEELPKVKELLTTKLPIYAIDVNSKFEQAPGVKDIRLLTQLKEKIKTA